MLKRLLSVIILFALFSSQVKEMTEETGQVKHKASDSQNGAFSHIRPEHRTVLARWLKNQPGLRLATETDCTDKESLEGYRKDWGKGFHPYYSIGDFNRDGKEDFAVLLIDLKKEEDHGFAIAIFNAPFDGKTDPNYFERGYIDIGRCYIGFNQIVKRRLYLGMFESDFYCVTFYPKGSGYVFKDCLS